MKMLSVSLAKFAGEVTSNAGMLRRFYCGSAGLAAIVVGLVIVILSIVRGYRRYIRLIAFPCFWLGGIIILCAYASKSHFDRVWLSTFAHVSELHLW